MFADTITITVNAVPNILARVNQDRYSSEYFLRGTTAEMRLFIRNSTYTDKKRGTIERHNVEFVQTVYPTEAGAAAKVRKIYTVFELAQGDDLVANVKHAVGLIAFLTESNLTKMANWES